MKNENLTTVENLTTAVKLGIIIIYSSIMFCLGVIVGLCLFTWI